jgi:hypothetical protein
MQRLFRRIALKIPAFLPAADEQDNGLGLPQKAYANWMVDFA